MSVETFMDDLKFSFKNSWVQTSAVGMFLTAIVFITVWIMYFAPLQNKLNQAEQELKQNIHTLKSIEHKKELLASFKTGQHKLAMQIKKLNRKITQADLIENITKLAQMNNLKIISESYKEEKEYNGYQPLIQSLILEGRYALIKRFTFMIKSLETWTVVEEFKLERMDGKKSLKVFLKLKTLKQKQSAE